MRKSADAPSDVALIKTMIPATSHTAKQTTSTANNLLVKLLGLSRRRIMRSEELITNASSDSKEQNDTKSTSP